jgi:hypothetical protein
MLLIISRMELDSPPRRVHAHDHSDSAKLARLFQAALDVIAGGRANGALDFEDSDQAGGLTRGRRFGGLLGSKAAARKERRERHDPTDRSENSHNINLKLMGRPLPASQRGHAVFLCYVLSCKCGATAGGLA